MPWRLIQFIFFFVIFLFFIGFNLENKCNINFWPGTLALKDVPVYFIVFCSFIVGMLCTLPFIFSFRSHRRTDTAQGKGLLAKISGEQNKDFGKKPEDSNLPDSSRYGID